MKIRKFEKADAQAVITLVAGVLRDEFHREASVFPMHDLEDIEHHVGGWGRRRKPLHVPGFACLGPTRRSLEVDVALPEHDYLAVQDDHLAELLQLLQLGEPAQELYVVPAPHD